MCHLPTADQKYSYDLSNISGVFAESKESTRPKAQLLSAWAKMAIGVDDAGGWNLQHGDGKSDGSQISGLTTNTTETGDEDLSVIGKMAVIQLKKDLWAKEKALLRKHTSEVRQARQ